MTGLQGLKMLFYKYLRAQQTPGHPRGEISSNQGEKEININLVGIRLHITIYGLINHIAT